MSDEITLKYFVNDGKIYELVYVLNEQNHDHAPKPLQKQFQQEIKQRIQDALESIKPKLEELEFSDVDCVKTKGSPLSDRLIELEEDISSHMSNTAEKVMTVYFSHKRPETTASSLMGPGLSIAPIQTEGMEFREFITSWAEPFLDSPIPETENLEDKLGFIKQKLQDLDPVSRKQALEYCTNQFLDYLKSPSSLMDLTCDRWAHCLEIFSILLGPKYNTPEAVFTYLHPELRKNKELVDNLKLFLDEKFCSGQALTVFDQHLSHRIQNKKEDQIKDANENGTPNDFLFEYMLSAPSFRIIKTQVDFLTLFAQMVHAKEIGQSESMYKLDPSLGTLNLRTTNENEWEDFDYPLLKDGENIIEDRVIDEDALFKEKEDQFLRQIQTDLKRYFSITIKTLAEDDSFTEELLTNSDRLKELLDEHFPIDIRENRVKRLEIVFNLHQGFFAKFYTPDPDAGLFGHGAYANLTLVLQDDNYDLFAESHMIPKTTEGNIKEMVVSREIIAHIENPQRQLQEMRVPLEPFSQETAFISLVNLTTKKGAGPVLTQMFFS